MIAETGKDSGVDRCSIQDRTPPSQAPVIVRYARIASRFVTTLSRVHALNSDLSRLPILYSRPSRASANVFPWEYASPSVTMYDISVFPQITTRDIGPRLDTIRARSSSANENPAAANADSKAARQRLGASGSLNLTRDISPVSAPLASMEPPTEVRRGKAVFVSAPIAYREPPTEVRRVKAVFVSAPLAYR